MQKNLWTSNSAYKIIAFGHLTFTVVLFPIQMSFVPQNKFFHCSSYFLSFWSIAVRSNNMVCSFWNQSGVISKPWAFGLRCSFWKAFLRLILLSVILLTQLSTYINWTEETFPSPLQSHCVEIFQNKKKGTRKEFTVISWQRNRINCRLNRYSIPMSQATEVRKSCQRKFEPAFLTDNPASW